MESAQGEGEVLAGRYRLGEVLGRGASALVFAAADTFTGSAVAVKLAPSAAPETGMGATLCSEARVLERLRSSGRGAGFAALIDAGVSGGREFLVLELVEGVNLRRQLRSSRPSCEQVLGWAEELLGTLALVHSLHVVHRDIKPANIMIRPTNMIREVQLPGGRQSAVLTDFGTALTTDSSEATADGTTTGTAAYLSPEQAIGESVGPASDIYSLGLVLIECLSGTPAFPGPPLESAVARLLRSPVIPAEAPRPVAQLLAAMTNREPNCRPDAVEALNVLATARDAPPVPPDTGAVLAPAA